MKNRERIKDGQPDLWCGKAQHDKMVGPVETMLTADGLQPTACGQDQDEIRIIESAADRSRH